MINLDALTRPFSQEDVKPRKDDAGKTVDFLEAHSVISRLNEAFGSAWSFRVVQLQMVEEAIIAEEDGFLLRMDRKLVPVTIEFLLKYIVFSKAEMTDLSDTYYCYGMMGSADNFPQADNTSSQINSDTVVCVSTNDQRYEIWSTEEKTTSDDARQWMSAEVRDGFAWVDETSTDSFIPQMFNLHAIEGISFEKGCYLGQEIVARLQYRGKLTKRLHRGRSDHATNTGDSLFNKEQKSVGTIVSSQKPDFLAVIQTKSGGDDSYQFSDGTTVELIDLAPQSG